MFNVGLWFKINCVHHQNKKTCQKLNFEILFLLFFVLLLVHLVPCPICHGRGPNFSYTFHYVFFVSLFRRGGDPKVFNELREAYEVVHPRCFMYGRVEVWIHEKTCWKVWRSSFLRGMEIPIKGELSRYRPAPLSVFQLDQMCQQKLIGFLSKGLARGVSGKIFFWNFREDVGNQFEN